MRSSLSWAALGAFSFSAFAIACGDSGTGGAGGASSSTTGSGSPTTATGTTGVGMTTGATTTGATTTSTSTGSSMAQAECTSAADCKLENDCCACEAIPNAMAFPMCMQTCLQSKCMELMYTGAPECQAGRCVAAFDCDADSVICATPPPACPPGTTPSVAGGCWDDKCVPAKECAFVADCAQCGDDQACVFYGGGIMKSHCIELPPECGGIASCACLGQSLCGGVACGDDGNGHLTCQIP